MRQVEVGRTGIRVSKLGIGTGSSDHKGGIAQRNMSPGKLAGLLLHGYRHGVTFWDTAKAYGTYVHIREALGCVARDSVVIATKITSSGSRDTRRWVEECLRELGTDYVDICLMHAIRTEREFHRKGDVLDTLVKCKAEGKVRAIGLSSHGLGALRKGLEVSDIEVVYGRINFAGYHMDGNTLGLYDSLASIPPVKKIYGLLPEGIKRVLHTGHGKPARVSDQDFTEVERLLSAIHDISKGVVGMKIMAEGLLGNASREAIRFALGRRYLDAIVVGMLTEREIDTNCKLVDGYMYS